MLRPPVPAKVEVAVVKLIPFVLPIERREPGVEEAMPVKPLAVRIVKAEKVEVAVPATVVVAR